MMKSLPLNWPRMVRLLNSALPSWLIVQPCTPVWKSGDWIAGRRRMVPPTTGSSQVPPPSPHDIGASLGRRGGDAARVGQHCPVVARLVPAPDVILMKLPLLGQAPDEEDDRGV